MTLDEFLDDYVPRVLKPMGGWHLYDLGSLHHGIRRAQGYGKPQCCPLTAAAGVASRHWVDCADEIGLPQEDAALIAASADNDTVTDEDDVEILARSWLSRTEILAQPDAAIRARLLSGLGLTESR